MVRKQLTRDSFQTQIICPIIFFGGIFKIVNTANISKNHQCIGNLIGWVGIVLYQLTGETACASKITCILSMFAIRLYLHVRILRQELDEAGSLFV